MWRVELERGVWSVNCGVESVKCEVWNLERAECEVWSAKCGL